MMEKAGEITGSLLMDSTEIITAQIATLKYLSLIISVLGPESDPLCQFTGPETITIFGTRN